MLEEAGIIPLTGESCKYNMRILCDLTTSGAAILDRFLGGATFSAENWNSGDPADPHVASVMLPRSIFPDLERFVQLQKNGSCDRNQHQMSGRTY